MKEYDIFKSITVLVLVVSLLFGPISALLVEASESTSTLNDSEVLNDQGEWVNDGSNFSRAPGIYNCYAYAIGRVDGNRFYNVNQNDLIYQPGDLFWDYKNELIYDTDIIKNKVRQDLEITGHTNILFYDGFDIIPKLNENQELICFRVGVSGYHFMKYDSNTNAWYHKPGSFAILKYTANQGIPSNDKTWSDERIDSGGVVLASQIDFNGPIIFITYTKPQLNVPLDDELQQNLNIKGKRYVCCDGTYVCSCNIQQLSGGMDSLCEIIVPESGCYTIEIETPTVRYNNNTAIASFNYEIYSYNMYNGDYDVLKSGSGQSGSTFTETVNLTAYNDYNDGSNDWQYQAYKHYIRLDFGRANTSDQTVNVSITHTHSYSHHYEQNTVAYHKAYCECGEHTLSHHSVEYYMYTSLQHKATCYCGYTYYEPHVFPISASHKICLRCGQMAGSGGIQIESTDEIIYLTDSGSYLCPDGTVMLSDIDVELYLAGELDINALISQAINPSV